MVWVLDSTALHAIPGACGGQGNCGPLLAGLGTLVTNQEACFGRGSIVALRALSPNGVHTVWATEVAAAMWTTTPTWLEQQTIVFALEDHIDFDLFDDEPELPSMLAIATRLAKTVDVTVVTEDTLDKPDIISTVTACGILDLPTLDLAGLCASAGLALTP